MSVLGALFTTSLHTREKTDVLIPGVSTEMLSLILEYAYVRTVEITQDNVCQLLIAADYLSVLGLLQLCCDFLRGMLEPETASASCSSPGNHHAILSNLTKWPSSSIFHFYCGPKICCLFLTHIVSFHVILYHCNLLRKINVDYRYSHYFVSWKKRRENRRPFALCFSTYFCSQLRADAHLYVMRNFVQVAKQSEELVELPLEEMLALVGADELNVKSEEVVWDCVLQWINHDPEARKMHVVDLMKNIRLGLLDTQFFLENVKDHVYVSGNESCRPLIIETLRFLYDLEVITQKDGEVPTPEIARPRIPHEILFAIGGWSGGSPTNYIETYDTRADRWVKVKIFLKYLIVAILTYPSDVS
ncbi:hypothetical protein ANN_00767, partial [Periplaneta americana]